MSKPLINIDEDVIGNHHGSNSDSLDSSDIESNSTKFTNGTCSRLVKKLLNLNGKLPLSCKGTAIFVPISIWSKFKEEMQNELISIVDEHTWDYDLKIGHKIHSTKLIWIRRYQSLIKVHRKVKKAFSFLQPDYMRYMDKPFTNFDAITQVNLVLEYHRKQKRYKGVEIFNIFDLIAFKMAIDDNRLDYENCEFHKLIDGTLTDVIQSGKYNKGVNFDLTRYSGDKQDFRKVPEIIDYLMYHYQNEIGSIVWNEFRYYPIKLTDIIDTQAFLESYSQTHVDLLITETDASGICAEVLFEIISKSTKKIEFRFEIDGEWIYKSDGQLNGIATPLMAKTMIKIKTKNTFHFIENFINWIKLMFGPRSQNFIIFKIDSFETVKPYIFTDLHVDQLIIWSAILDYKLIRMLTKCKHRSIRFRHCQIENDINERFEYIGHRSDGGQNIFKCFDDLHNVEHINFMWEEHTIGILYAYVASVMRQNNLTVFQLRNITFLWPGKFLDQPLKFQRDCVNTDFEQIDAYTRWPGDKIDFYEYRNNLKPSEQHEFDFYQ